MPKRSRKKRHPRKRWLAVLIGAAAILLLAILAAFLTAPDVTSLRTRNPAETAMMRYREAGAKASRRPIGRLQYWVPFSRISPFLIQAVLISEDDKFYAHEGFDWQGIRDALEKNIRSGHVVGGGSTITQQLAKNLYLKPTRSPLRKLREAVIAFLLDKRLKKRRILELYLNVIEWGRGIYGAEAAAQVYYQKAASDLALAEAVRLASVLPNPLRYQPDSDAVNWLREKRRLIGERMLMKHWIDEGQYRGLCNDVDPGFLPIQSDTAAVAEIISFSADSVNATSPYPPDSVQTDPVLLPSAR
jgi:monofunctional biosynthetic peptidoglycan transglycosylase